MKKVLILFLLVVGTKAANAQIKEREDGQKIFIRKSAKELRLAQDDARTEMAKKIAAVVQPVIDQLGKLMEADPDTYKAYQKDIAAIGDAKTIEEKRSGIANVSKKYYPFVRKIWEQANIDEQDYQTKIKGMFPDNIKDRIKFSEFLRFEYELAQPVQPYRPGSGLQTFNPTQPTNKPDDPNPFLCFDEVPVSRAVFDVSKSGIGNNAHNYGPFNYIDRTASINTSTDSQGPWGCWSDAGITVDSISIPGRVPLDSRHLQTIKNYKWSGNAYAVSVLGTSLAAYYETPFYGSAFKDWQTEIFICSPITFVLYSSKDVTKTYSNVISKPSGNFLLFGFGAANYSSASGLAFAGAQSKVAGSKWTLCEIP